VAPVSSLRRRVRRVWRALRPPAVPEAGEIVSLDLETSSLDPRTAAILSIAAVPIRDRRIALSEAFERKVAGDVPVDPEAVKYHRLLPVDVAQGATAVDAAADFVEWLGDRPVIGYCTGFDCKMLDRVLRENGRDGFEPKRFDLRDLYRRAILRSNPEDAPPRALDEMLARLGVPLMARHTARGDATAVAMAYLLLSKDRN
jgi:DNA polymerase-3 subunit epsilon